MQPSPAKPEPPQARDKWKKKRKHNGPSLIERLAAMYPTTFDFHAPVPLAVAVDHQIAASRRFNLDGSDAGSVDDEHRAQAAAKLAEKMAVTLPKAAVSEGEYPCGFWSSDNSAGNWPAP